MTKPGRPSPAMAVALLALFVALGGSGYAATKLKSNKITYVKRSIPGKAVKPNSITGKQVKESKLREVRRATNADSADLLGGLGAGAFQQRVHSAWVAANGDINSQTDGIAVTKAPGTGTYFVDFGHDVFDAALLATPVTAGTQATAKVCGGQPGANCTQSNNRNTVVVATSDGSGADQNISFHIAAIE